MVFTDMYRKDDREEEIRKEKEEMEGKPVQESKT